MHLKSISLYGFKTFAQKTDFAFKPGITAVIGPNGCGKSNLFDAIVWVLGEQSMRSLRGRKMEDVVFHGSESKKPLGFAQVKLTFDNEDGSFPLPHSEISIVRRYYKSGDSEFEINGQSCRLRDIQNLLLDTGMGKLNYSIINQGDIEYIIGLSPVERRTVFDEAAGINKYKVEKKKTLGKIKDTDANIARLRDLLTDIEERLEPLREQAETAKRYEELTERIESLKMRVMVSEIRRLHAQINNQNEQEKSCIAEIAASEKKTEQGREDREEGRAELAAAHAELNVAGQQLGQLRGRLENHQQSLQFMQNALDRMDQEKQRLESELASWHARRADLEREIRELEQRRESGREAVVVSEKQLHDALSAHGAEPDEDLEKTLGRRLAESRNRFDGIRGQAQELRADLRAARDAAAASERGLEQKRKDAENSEDLINNIAKKRQALEKELEGARAGAADAEKQLGELEKNAAGLAQQRDALTAWLETAREELAYMRARAEHLAALSRAARAHSPAADKWIKLANDSAPAQLDMEIKAGREPAVRRALGALRDAFLLKSAADIKSLTPRQAGELCCVIAESLPEPNTKLIDKLKKEKGAIGILSESVKAKGGAAAAVNRLLSRFVVVEDAAALVRLAAKLESGAALITQGGDAVCGDGVLTLGEGLGGREDLEKISAELGPAMDKARAEIKNKEDELKKIQSKLQSGEDRRRSIETTAKKAGLREVELAGGMATLDRETALHTETLDALIQSEIAARAAHDKIVGDQKQKEDALAALEKQIEERGKEYEELDKQLARVMDTRRARQEAIQELRLKINDAKSERRAIEESIAYRNADMERARERVGLLEKDLVRARGEVETRAGELVKARADGSGLVEQVAAAEEDTARRQDAISQLQQKIKQKERDISELEQDVNSLREKLLQTRLRRERADAQLEEQRRVFLDEFPGIDEKQALETAEPAVADERSEYKRLRAERETMGPVNMLAIGEYEDEKQRFDLLLSQIGDLEDTRATLMDMVNEFDDRSRGQFLDTFHAIQGKFKETFQEVFMGGDCELTLTDESDPLESGVEIAVGMPGKRMRNIRLLSGGEKALTALTLIFAILKVKPSPFYLMDEVDAGLDDTNVDKFKRLLTTYKHEVQFLVVTHNKGTIVGADHYYGITMEGTEGYTRVLSVSLEQVG